MTFKRSSLRYGATPPVVTPYQKASQVWDERIGSSRVQAHNWRLMAFGCLGVSIALLCGLVWLLRWGSAVPYVVELDRNGGVRSVVCRRRAAARNGAAARSAHRAHRCRLA
jgi:type IV secretion system protein VirB5